MPYVAHEVLRESHYTQVLLCILQQLKNNCAHDELLALEICKRIRPEINEKGAHKNYIDLINKCWDSGPVNRLNVIKVEKLICFIQYNKCNVKNLITIDRQMLNKLIRYDENL